MNKAEVVDRPIKMLVLSLTGRCNFACRYCYAHLHSAEVMQVATALQAVALASRSGKPFLLQFSGGEPLLAFDVLQEVVRYVRRRRIPAMMQLQTNAALITAEMAVFLRQHSVGVGISLDGRPAINDQMRQLPNGQGTCRDILAGAAQLAAASVEVGITCVVTAANVRMLSGVVEMAYYLGNVRRIGFDLLRAQGRGSLITPPSPAALRHGLQAVFSTARRLEQETGRPLLIAQLERVQTLSRGRTGGFSHCHSMNGQALFVDATGNLYACSSLVGDARFWLGHVNTGIDEGRRQAIAQTMQAAMEFCTRCASFALCGGGCFARWLGAGCIGAAYAVECTLKQQAIEWVANGCLGLTKADALCNT